MEAILGLICLLATLLCVLVVPALVIWAICVRDSGFFFALSARAACSFCTLTVSSRAPGANCGLSRKLTV